MIAERGHIAGLYVRGGAQVEAHAALRELSRERRVFGGALAVGDPLGLDFEGAPDLRGAVPLAGMERDAQPARTRRFERTPVQERIGKRGLGPGEIPAREA